MPSQVLTKRRVKRRQQRQRLVSKNAKRKVRSVRKHRKTAKKVMRGGGLFGSTPIDWQIYTLYDKIYNLKDVNPSPFSIPICVCLCNVTDEEAYLFFNNNMTADEASIILKKILGIEENQKFELDPPLQIVPVPIKDEKTPEETTTGEKYLSPTFVKIFKNFMSWNIKSGTVTDYTTEFDTLATVEHKITKVSIKIKKIRENFMGLGRVVELKVLPELYKDYVTTKKVSTKYGFNEKDFSLYAGKRYILSTSTERFTTIKGTHPINLNLVRAKLLYAYPYIEKEWWVEEEKKLLASKEEARLKGEAEAAAAKKMHEEALNNERAYGQ
jgi:hypothetical protein